SSPGANRPEVALRRLGVTNVWRASRELFLAQQFARHAFVQTYPFGGRRDAEEARTTRPYSPEFRHPLIDRVRWNLRQSLTATLSPLDRRLPRQRRLASRRIRL